MRRSEGFRLIRLADARQRIPGPEGEHARVVLHHGTLDVALSMPATPVRQTPHSQDEVYVVVRGSAVLVYGGERSRCDAGDLLFVAAGEEHQFDQTTGDFAVWRVFYGPSGGEVPIADGA